jgi:predicted nucleic acid-binding protein
MIFCDTSCVAKFYLAERESAAVRDRIMGQDDVWVSELVRVELMATFHRHLREKKWTRVQFTSVVSQFSHHDLAGNWNWLPLDDAILREAAQLFTTLSDEIFLRSSDCLHLATALHYRFEEIYTFDVHQAAAAAALGLRARRA